VSRSSSAVTAVTGPPAGHLDPDWALVVIAAAQLMVVFDGTIVPMDKKAEVRQAGERRLVLSPTSNGKL
jgi:hypothetical protein